MLANWWCNSGQLREWPAMAEGSRKPRAEVAVTGGCGDTSLLPEFSDDRKKMHGIRSL